MKDAHGVKELRVDALTREAFAPFGDVVEIAGSTHFSVNRNTAERYHDLANIDVCARGGRPLINLFRASPRALPLEVRSMERHPLGSQAFLPLNQRPYLIVVAARGELDPRRLRAFATQGWQGVNYARGVWHHALLALEETCDFIVIDRGGEGPNLDEEALPEPVWLTEKEVRGAIDPG
ncbi:MAG TPA: ureidoglycolate lyase [Terrimicrobiaceae bacterium]